VARPDVIEQFRAFLRDHNLPVTAQRQAVAEVVLTSDRHLSVGRSSASWRWPA
jgi:Fe2+ or Zn2+ uptake regulation protein